MIHDPDKCAVCNNPRFLLANEVPLCLDHYLLRLQGYVFLVECENLPEMNFDHQNAISWASNNRTGRQGQVMASIILQSMNHPIPPGTLSEDVVMFVQKKDFDTLIRLYQ